MPVLPEPKAIDQTGAFIRDSKMTIWFSVPSTGVFMRRLGMLKPDMYPNLRLTLFCGEALSGGNGARLGQGGSEFRD